MKMITDEKVNFNSLEENTYKKVMKLGRELIIDNLRTLDNLIKQYRDKEIFKVKDFQRTTIKTKLGEIEFSRRRYEMETNGIKKCIYLLDELLEINCIGQYSQSVVEMIIREITKKSYRETAKTVSEDTESQITYTAVRKIVLELGEKIKNLEEEKIKLYEEGKIEGTKEAEYIFCEHDGIYIKKQKSKKHKGKKKFKVKHFKKKKGKKKKNGIELKIAVIHEGKEPRYTNDYKLKNKIIVGTRGWAFGEDAESKRMLQREMARLELSIKNGIENYGENKEIIAFLHYPPIINQNIQNNEMNEFIRILKKYDIKKCYYGHLHGAAIKEAVEGEYFGITFKLVSADAIQFNLVKIK